MNEARFGQEPQEGAIREYLDPEQNILNQEPYRNILDGALQTSRYFEPSHQLFQEPRTAAWEEQQLHVHETALRAFLINTALRRPDIPRRLREVKPEERDKLFEWGGEFATLGKSVVHLSKLTQGVPKRLFLNLLNDQDYQKLFSKLMIVAADHPDWDAYIRSQQLSIKSNGSQIKGKNIENKIPTFDHWSKNKK